LAQTFASLPQLDANEKWRAFFNEQPGIFWDSKQSAPRVLVRELIGLCVDVEKQSRECPRVVAPLAMAHKIYQELNGKGQLPVRLRLNYIVDQSVPIQQALDMVKALEAAKIPHKFVRYKDRGHVGLTDEVLQEAKAFIDTRSSKTGSERLVACQP